MQVTAPPIFELCSPLLAKRALQATRDALVQDGRVMVKGIKACSELELLEAPMREDTTRLLEFVDLYDGKPRMDGHLQQGPPPLFGFVLNGIVINPTLNQVTANVLSPPPALTFYNGNSIGSGSCV